MLFMDENAHMLIILGFTMVLYKVIINFHLEKEILMCCNHVENLCKS